VRKQITTILKLVILSGAVAVAVYWLRFSPVTVTAYNVTAGSVVNEVLGTGTLEAKVRADISPKISGLLVNVAADQNDRIVKGQLLAQLDDADLRHQVEVAQSDLAATKATIKRIESEIAAVQASSYAIGLFSVFFNQQMGLTLDQIGKLSAISGVAALVAMYFAALFIDRWHPVRVNTYLAVFGIVGNLMGWVWLFVSIPGKYYFWLSMGTSIAGAFQIALVGGAMLPLYMRCFPQSRYGQICSAQALFRSLCALVCGIIAGGFMDMMKWLYHGSDFAYRYYFAWGLLFSFLLALVGVLLYREWYRLGGDSHYHSPASWSEKGYEELAIVAIVGPQRRWLKLGFLLITAILLIAIACIAVMMYWMNLNQMNRAFFWHGTVLLPAAVAILVLWTVIRTRISHDITRSQNGEPLKNGIPHHGVIIVIACQYLAYIPIWIAQLIVSITHHMETGAVVFTTANLLVDLVLIGCIWFLARLERHHLTRVDTMLAENE